jgi:hypothetical protein
MSPRNKTFRFAILVHNHPDNIEKIIIKIAGTVSMNLTEVGLDSGKAMAIFARSGAIAAPDITVSSDNDRIVGLIIGCTGYLLSNFFFRSILHTAAEYIA